MNNLACSSHLNVSNNFEDEILGIVFDFYKSGLTVDNIQ